MNDTTFFASPTYRYCYEFGDITHIIHNFLLALYVQSTLFFRGFFFRGNALSRFVYEKMLFRGFLKNRERMLFRDFFRERIFFRGKTPRKNVLSRKSSFAVGLKTK